MSSFRHAQVANKGCGVEKHRGAFCGGGGGSCPPFSFYPWGGTQKRHHHPTAKANGSDGADSVQPASRLRRVRSTKKSRRSRALANFGRAAGRVRHCHSGTEAARQGKAAYPTNVVTGKRFRGSALVESGWTATNSRSRLTISRTVKTFRTQTRQVKQAPSETSKSGRIWSECKWSSDKRGGNDRRFHDQVSL